MTLLIRSLIPGAAILAMTWLVASLAHSAQLDPSRFPVIGAFKNTHYYSVLESDYETGLAKDAKNCPVRSTRGTTLATVSCRFKKAMDIEGTGKLMDGRVLNFAAYRNRKFYYKVSANPYGDGVGTCALVPFRTIAVDKRKIALGSVVYIDETVGMRLPDGTIHDGFWRADDVGGAIKENRVDIFVGEGKASGATLAEHGISHMQALTVRLVAPPEEISCAHPQGILF